MNESLVAVLVLVVIAVVIVTFVVQIWRRFRQPTLRAFWAFGLATAWWCLAYAVEIWVPNEGVKVLSAKAQYIGIVVAPPAWALFAYEYTRQGKRLPHRWLAVAAVVPTLTLVFMWGYPAVRLVWRAHRLLTETAFRTLDATYGPWFWVHVIYSYLALLVGTSYLVRFMRRRQEFYRGQAMSLALAVGLPWVANFLYISDRNPFPGLDLTPFAFGVSVLALMWGFFHYQLFGVVPVARETIIRDSPVGVLVTDLEGRVLDLNPAAARLLRVEHGRILGQRISDAIPHAAQTLDTLLNTEGRQEMRVTLNGGERYLEAHTVVLQDPRGRPLGRVITFHDITEMRKQALELTMARNAAEAANRARSRFLANMSHELRTPLTVIIGYAEMMAEDLAAGDYEALLPSLQRIQSAGQHLLTLISEILDMAKIESGQMTLDLSWFDGDVLFDEVVAAVEPLVTRQGNQFHVERPESVGRLYSDRAKVYQILYHLLSNAAKFTRDGHVTLRVAAEGGSNGAGTLCVEVADTGVGIPPEKMDAIFRPFEQADTSTTRSFSGTGLGLPITRHFCQLLGGTIEVRSAVGKGTVFRVCLPRVVSVPAGEEAPASPSSLIEPQAREQE